MTSSSTRHKNLLKFLRRKIVLSFISVFILSLLFQFVIVQRSYFQALAQCLDPSNPRADFLITSPTQGSNSRFYSRIGTCIIDPDASIGEFRQTTYLQLYEEFFVKSKVANKTTIAGDATQANFNNMASGIFVVKANGAQIGSVTLSANPTGGPVTSVIFVEGNLYITQNFTYGSANQGVVFIVKGSVYISSNVTQIDGVIISQGATANSFSICTATDVSGNCPVTAVDVGTNTLVVNGSLVALDKTKPIKFTRKLTNNLTAAEQVNHQVKYLSILNTLLSKPTNIISEGTNFAICTADTNRPAGCPCEAASQCTGGAQSCVGNICQSPTGPIEGGTTPTQPTPTDTPTPQPSATPYPPQMVAHWPMDEASGTVVQDVVGGNTGSAYGTTVVAGKIGSARDLSNGSFITVNNTSAFQSQYTSVSTWVYPKDVTGSYASLFNRRNAQNSYSFIVELNGSGGIQCVANGVSVTSGARKLAMNSWNHVVCTYNGSVLKLYFNKVEVGSAAATGALTNPANPSVQLGRNIFNSQSLIGSLDDMRVYSYALSTQEITDLCGASCPFTPVYTNPWIIDGLYYLTDFRGI